MFHESTRIGTTKCGRCPLDIVQLLSRNPNSTFVMFVVSVMNSKTSFRHLLPLRRGGGAVCLLYSRPPISVVPSSTSARPSTSSLSYLFSILPDIVAAALLLLKRISSSKINTTVHEKARQTQPHSSSRLRRAPSLASLPLYSNL